MSSIGFPEAGPPGGKPLINSIWDFSDAALGQLRLWFEQNPPAIGISNILGFSAFTAQVAQVDTQQSTTSATYANLTTVGPQLTGLPDGKYILLYGALMFSDTAGVGCFMGPKVNSTEATDPVAAVGSVTTTSASTFSTFTQATLNGGGNNTVTLRYRSNGTASATFAYRRLIALRYSNL